MKKLLLSLLLVLPFCSFAQKGMQGIGVNLGGGTCYDSDCSLGEFSLKYQNYITDDIRISSHFKYYEITETVDYESEDYYSGWNLGCDCHFFFTQIKRFRTYGIVGLSFGSTTVDYYYEDDDNYPAVCIEAGIGIDYRIGYHFSLQGEFIPFYGYSATHLLLLYPFRIGITCTF